MFFNLSVIIRLGWLMMGVRMSVRFKMTLIVRTSQMIRCQVLIKLFAHIITLL